MKRSASTLHYQLAARLVERSRRGARLEWCQPEDHARVLAAYKGRTDYLVFKSHELTKPLSREFAGANARALYIFRDVRDAIASGIRMWGRPSVDVRQWTRDLLVQFSRWTDVPDRLVSRYEDVVNDIPGETVRIASYLKIALPHQELMSIAEEHGLEAQRTRSAAVGRSTLRTFGRHTVDAETLLHPGHVTSGVVGEWRAVLTRTDIDTIERLAGDWLRDQGYQ